ncbi:hypothetical protein C0Q59_29245 [Streptomyces albidoflavus]|uniref:hypothetical protein n=1 Tax=Streptomyces albidoflavus TaxID=1886 RepID=UPI0010206AEF|nr:hypothetical protein [Streptomyces albidoflavus]RZD54746.1 hypothetical protein C0Q59_29245 [Streptomyces albidoflavus]
MSGPAGHRSPAACYELVRSSWSGAALHVRVTLWGRPGGPVVDEHLCVALDAPAHLLHHADVLLGQGEEPGARLLDRFPGAAVVGLRRGDRAELWWRAGAPRPTGSGPVVLGLALPPGRTQEWRMRASVLHAVRAAGESPQAALGLPLVGQPSPSAVTRARQARTT